MTMAHRNVLTLPARQDEADTPLNLLTVEEAAAEAKVSVNTIRRAYEHGHLPVLRFGVGGRFIRVRRRALVTWLEQAHGETGTSR